MTLTKPIGRMTLAELRKHARSVGHLAAAVSGNRLNECPGWKRACGVTTSRALCFFCQRSKDQEKENG